MVSIPDRLDEDHFSGKIEEGTKEEDKCVCVCVYVCVWFCLCFILIFKFEG